MKPGRGGETGRPLLADDPDYGPKDLNPPKAVIIPKIEIETTRHIFNRDRF